MVAGNLKNIKSSILLDGNQAFIEYIFLDTVFQLTDKGTDNNQSKEDLLFYSLIFINTYESNKKEQKAELKLFMNDIYSGRIKNNCVIWYTRENFVYRMVNTVLRKQDLIEIFWIRYFINLLRKNLKEYSQYNTDKVLYRGTIVPKKEFTIMKERIGKPFLLNGFISTSGNIEIAQKFIKSEKNDEYENVLFVFECDDKDKPNYSCIKNLSKFPHEEENLINMNNFFKITKYEQKTSGDKTYTQIFLKFAYLDELRKNVNKVTLDHETHLKNTLLVNHSCDSFFLAEILSLLSKGDEILRLFQTFKSNKEIEIADMNSYLGEAYHCKKEYDKSIEHHNIALKIKLELLKEDHQKTAFSYHNLAINYCEKGLNEKAYEYSTKALKIRQTLLGDDHMDTSDSYLMEGILLFQWKKVNKEAISYIKKALEIKKRILGENHPEIADCYMNLSAIYFSSDYFEEASELDNKALKIYESCYGETHPTTGVCYTNIAINYIEKGKFEKAHDYLSKGLEIKLKSVEENNILVAESYKLFGELFSEKQDKNKALEYLTKALTISKEKLGENDSFTKEIKEKIDHVNREKETVLNDDSAGEEAEELD